VRILAVKRAYVVILNLKAPNPYTLKPNRQPLTPKLSTLIP